MQPDGNRERNATAELARIRAEYRRRAAEVPADLYSPEQPWTRLFVEERTRLAGAMLRRAGISLGPGMPVLEIGCGGGGWLPTFLAWGLRETDLHGIDLDADRIRKAQQSLPHANLAVGDATRLPASEGTFHLVVASTVLTSILDPRMRTRVADEIQRVLAPGGALLWYDFAWNNPRNPNVRKVTRRELASLFPSLRGEVRGVTLAPPLARCIAPRSYTLAKWLAKVPFLRTHLLAVLVKPKIINR